MKFVDWEDVVDSSFSSKEQLEEKEAQLTLYIAKKVLGKNDPRYLNLNRVHQQFRLKEGDGYDINIEDLNRILITKCFQFVPNLKYGVLPISTLFNEKKLSNMGPIRWIMKNWNESVDYYVMYEKEMVRSLFGGLALIAYPESYREFTPILYVRLPPPVDRMVGLTRLSVICQALEHEFDDTL